MRKGRGKIWYVGALLLFPFLVGGQSVGLVLSGGGAKGIAHIGVLKALEENNIPIDYLAGTSMGGVVAGCYAAGWSPEKIETVFLSDDFQRWINGKLERGHNYYFSKDDVNPSFLRVHLSLDSTLSLNLNTALANDLSLNFALAERMAMPAYMAHYNFDSLFVPLRVVASDIFTQNQVVLKTGNLADALRATHTVPFFYEPIRINEKFLFDGGVYNNFPADVLQNDFKPTTLIGVNVSSKVFDEYPYEQDEALVSRSLLYMLLDKSDPGKIPEGGVYIQPNLKGFSSIDFKKVRALIDSGYVQTMRQMPEIKAKTAFLRQKETVEQARAAFNLQQGEVLVDHVSFKGFNASQKRYLSRFFPLKKGPLSVEKVKAGFYNLVSDEYFKNVYPRFTKHPGDQHFEFELESRPKKNFQVDFGGVISTRNISSLFLGANYYYFNRALTHSTINILIGNFYKSAQLKTRIDVPLAGRFYIEPEAIFNDWRFLANRELLASKTSPTILRRIDRRMGVNMGFPLSKQLKLVASGAYLNNSDRFSNNDVLISTDTLDILRLDGWRASLGIETNNLNRKQYATAGKNILLRFDWFRVNEKFNPGNTSVLENPIKATHSWIRAKAMVEKYWRTGVYSAGFLVESVLSNQPTFSNYTGSLVNASAFNPLQDSKTLLLNNFRAYNYVAGGLRNVFSLRPNLDFRLEGYIFKPIEALVKGAGQTTQLSDDLTKISLAGTAGFVLNSTVGPISLSVNYYDDTKHQIGVMAHIGYLLFQKTSVE